MVLMLSRFFSWLARQYETIRLIVAGSSRSPYTKRCLMPISLRAPCSTSPPTGRQPWEPEKALLRFSFGRNDEVVLDQFQPRGPKDLLGIGNERVVDEWLPEGVLEAVLVDPIDDEPDLWFDHDSSSA
jgi:hypothetical protein